MAAVVSALGDTVASLADALRAQACRLATAESCTGGLIAAACTELAGSSDWFECGFVSYSNAAKSTMLGVPMSLIEAHGAVSEPVAVAMAQGALARCAAQWAVAVTGIAGPGGGTPNKPVGTVWVSWAQQDGLARAQCFQFQGDRQSVREQTVHHALQGLLSLVQPTHP